MGEGGGGERTSTATLALLFVAVAVDTAALVATSDDVAKPGNDSEVEWVGLAGFDAEFESGETESGDAECACAASASSVEDAGEPGEAKIDRSTSFQ